MKTPYGLNTEPSSKLLSPETGSLCCTMQDPNCVLLKMRPTSVISFVLINKHFYYTFIPYTENRILQIIATDAEHLFCQCISGINRATWTNSCANLAAASEKQQGNKSANSPLVHVKLHSWEEQFHFFHLLLQPPNSQSIIGLGRYHDSGDALSKVGKDSYGEIL